MTTKLLLLLRPRQRLQSIVRSVCLCVCLSARISLEPHVWSLPNFFVYFADVHGLVLLDWLHRLSTGWWEYTARAKHNLRLSSCCCCCCNFWLNSILFCFLPSELIVSFGCYFLFMLRLLICHRLDVWAIDLLCIFGSRPSDHYFRSVSVCLFVCAEFFSAVFDPISIKLGHMLYVWV